MPNWKPNWKNTRKLFLNKTSSGASENNSTADSDADPLNPAPVPSWLETYQVLLLGGGLIVGIILHGFIVRPKMVSRLPGDTAPAAGVAESKHVTNTDLKVSTISEKKTPDTPVKKTEKSEKKST